MGGFRESRTAKNLLISFSAESQARTRYNFFARRAENDGYMQIAKIFDETQIRSTNMPVLWSGPFHAMRKKHGGVSVVVFFILENLPRQNALPASSLPDILSFLLKTGRKKGL